MTSNIIRRPIGGSQRQRKVFSNREPDQPDFGRIAADFSAAVDAVRMPALQKFAAAVGSSIESLCRLGVGWDASEKTWCFPMFNSGRHVVGLRRYTNTGREVSSQDGAAGIFWPVGLSFDRPLFLPEGVVDTAALLDLDFNVIGRPSCRGGVEQIVSLVKRHHPGQIIIVARNTLVSLGAADALAARLLLYSQDVRVIRQANGWLRKDILALIDKATIWRLDMIWDNRRASGWQLEKVIAGARRP